jgi:hypothetical protein
LIEQLAAIFPDMDKQVRLFLQLFLYYYYYYYYYYYCKMIGWLIFYLFNSD